jgi:hypothetical protein
MRTARRVGVRFRIHVSSVAAYPFLACDPALGSCEVTLERGSKRGINAPFDRRAGLDWKTERSRTDSNESGRIIEE